jgi:riboflavin transporter FmnP
MQGNTRKLTVMAMLVAISVVLVYLVRFPIFPTATFLEYDPADIPILIGTFAFGPLAGVVLTILASGIQALTVSAQSGLYGFVMHAIATSTLVLVAGCIYRYKKTMTGAVIGLVCGTLAMGGIMMNANHFVTPLFTGWPTEQVDALLLPIILPFNLIKAGINSAVTFVLYKVISKYIIHGKTGTPVKT